MKYRIELSSFRSNKTINDYLAGKQSDPGHIRWCAQVVDAKGQKIAVDDNWGLAYSFADTKEAALLDLRTKLAKHEAEKKEIEALNIKMGEIVELEL